MSVYRAVDATDLTFLHRKVVLVTSAADQRNPPTGRRGTLLVEEDPAEGQRVSLDIEFPEMYTSRAHRRRILLSAEEIERLLATGHYGAYSLCLPGRLDPALASGNE